MQATLERPEAAMSAKKRGRPATSDRDDTTIKIDRQVAADLRYVAEYRGIPLAELATDLLRPLAKREFEKCLREKNSRGRAEHD